MRRTGQRRTARFQLVGTCTALVASLALADAASAKNHLWRLVEFYSDPSGQQQFVELLECCGSNTEEQTQGSTLASNSNVYVLDHDLEKPTGNKRFLLATQRFADRSDAPEPDYIIPPNFFDPSGDTIRYDTTIDIVTFGAIPTDGIHSIDRDGVVGVNSPTNFSGAQGSVNLPALPAWALSIAAVLTASIGIFVLHARRRSLAGRGSWLED
jgi:hypothetical protein